MNEIEHLLKSVGIEEACFRSSMELQDYETAQGCSERITLLVRQIRLCQKQAIGEAK